MPVPNHQRGGMFEHLKQYKKRTPLHAELRPLADIRPVH